MLAPFTFARFMIGWGSIVLLFFWVHFFILFHETGKPLGPFRKRMIRLGTYLSGRIVIYAMSCFWINTPKHDANYKKYLGPDWVEDTNMIPGSCISNHATFMDIILHMYRQPPSHISKAGVRHIPFVGSIAAAVGCLFIERSDKGQRKDLIEQIADRQIESEKGLFPPLILYPEGGTTNGTHLIKFKKGAFHACRSIQPICIRY